MTADAVGEMRGRRIHVSIVVHWSLPHDTSMAEAGGPDGKINTRASTWSNQMDESASP